jgi:hypothetical protein
MLAGLIELLRVGDSGYPGAWTGMVMELHVNRGQ